MEKFEIAVNMANSRKTNVHLKWNPATLWQLLRRTDNYPRLVDELVREATSSEDQSLLDLIDATKNNDWFREFLMEGGYANLFRSEDSEEIERGAFFEMWGPRDPTIFQIQVGSSYYRSFASELSSIINFPVHYENQFPCLEIFQSFWVLRPVTLVRTKKARLFDVDIQDNTIDEITFRFDSHFTVGQQKEASIAFFDELMSNRLRTNSPQYQLSRDVDFSKKLEAWDMYKNGSTEKEIYDELIENNSAKRYHKEKKKISEMLASVERAKQVFFPQLETEEEKI